MVPRFHLFTSTSEGVKALNLGLECVQTRSVENGCPSLNTAFTSTDFTLLWLVNLEGFVAFWTTIVLRTFLRWHVTPAWEVRWTKHIWIFWQKADVFIYFNGTSMKLEVFKWPILASSSLFNCSKCWSWQKLSWASKKRTFTTKACQRLCLKNR